MSDTPAAKLLRGECPACDDNGETDNAIYGFGKCTLCAGLNIWPLSCVHCKQPLFNEVVRDAEIGRVDFWVHNEDGAVVCGIADGQPLAATPMNPPPEIEVR